MNNFFLKFLNIYLFTEKKYIVQSTGLEFKNRGIFKTLFILYMILFFIYFLSVGFVIDMKLGGLSASIFYLGFIFILIFIAILYIVFFFNRNNQIPLTRGILYSLILLILIPLLYLYIGNITIPVGINYYFFYIFFVFLYFCLLPKITDFLLNIRINILFVYKVSMKSVFIKFDSHNIIKIVNKLYINKKITYIKTLKYSDKLKNKFKFYGGGLFIYTLLNLIFGINIYDLYQNHFIPFLQKFPIFIDTILDNNMGLLIISKTLYLTLLIVIIVGFAFLILRTFSLYVEIYFFDLLLLRLEKLKNKKNSNNK